ncbi:hypothetical protein UA08_02485 [Talaromyces atroroseus]|uniref:PH-response regulator protein palI/RIM9 n=1 Tax=Talaromyces atroroseus TaxID=1441469 RepID=A0A225AWX8_TALAT|nr:hypothetical protein UA08_02485 [Talaromyces atroroseus]OKL61828.1 hypothetical protein UA08_02485 [Talaromyces atroroseus]
MLLKPATPLSVLLFISFVLLLLSTLSTPVIRAIPLATYQNVDFGVFGYCRGSTCSVARVGYDTENIFGASESSDFNLSSSARNYLSAILIVHPVAAFLVLVCLIMAVASHFHSPSHSPRYLLALLILLLPTVLVTLLAFLVDILLFVPHLKWGGWIVLAATILLVACGVVTCAMRRTLVSRKARRKLVSENAEMNGENYYARQDAEAAAAGLAKAESPPPLSSDLKTPLISSNSNADSAPTFTTYNSSRATDDGSHTLADSGNHGFSTAEESAAFYDHSIRPVRPGYHGPRDEYGNPIPPAASGTSEGGGGGAGMIRSNSTERMLQSQYSDGSLGSQRGPPQGYGPPGQPPRGRGYPPRGGYGRGGPGPMPYGSRGRGPPPNGRGGSVRGMRGGPPPGGMPRGRGPPPGYPPRRDGYDHYAAMGRRPSDGSGGGYGPSRSNSNNYSRPYPPSHMRNPSASQPNLPELNDPSYAIEMMPQSSEPNLRVRNGEDLAQPNRFSNNESIPSPTSVYSNEPYAPPRSGWAAQGRMGRVDERGMTSSSPQHTREPSGDQYFEDVDPRFADDTASPMPSALLAGRPNGEIEPPASLKIPGENAGNGPYSPAISDISQGSHFTSISERPINPNWQGPAAAPASGPAAANRGPRVQDVVLDANPDFELSRGRGDGRYGRGGRMTPVIENRGRRY